MINKGLAVAMKERGCTNKQIADELNCSVDWCKRNLKGVQKNKPEKGAIQEAIKSAQSPDAITNVEIINLVHSVYPQQKGKEYEAMSAKAVARFKDAINKADNTIIRPYWMQPENAQHSLNLVLDAVNVISERMTEAVDDIRRTLDLNTTYDLSLRFAIIKMLMGSTLAREGIENHCEYLADVACRLEAKNGNNTFSPPISNCREKCAPKPTSSEECISLEEYELMSLDDIAF